MIEATKVRAGYGDGADILNGIDLRTTAGETATILGLNGRGKSTLLKCIAEAARDHRRLGPRF